MVQGFSLAAVGVGVGVQCLTRHYHPLGARNNSAAAPWNPWQEQTVVVVAHSQVVKRQKLSTPATLSSRMESGATALWGVRDLESHPSLKASGQGRPTAGSCPRALSGEGRATQAWAFGAAAPWLGTSAAGGKVRLPSAHSRPSDRGCRIHTSLG